MAPTNNRSNQARANTTTKAVKHKFGQDSREFKELVLMFQNGIISAADKPGAIKSRYPQLFEKFTGPQFRAQFSKARTLSGAAGAYSL